MTVQSASPNWTPTLDWSSESKRQYEVGVDRGVVFYGGTGYSWPGLVSVEVIPISGDSEVRYIDGIPYRKSSPMDNYEGTIEAFTYPSEINAALGQEMKLGLKVYGRRKAPISLCYRVLEGDGYGHETHYSIRFLWNVIASYQGKTNETITDSTEPASSTWSFSAIGEYVYEFGNVAYASLSTRDVSPAAMENVEKKIYGWNGSAPTPLSFADILQLV